jgi:phosphoserine phosphatase RsbU/P
MNLTVFIFFISIISIHIAGYVLNIPPISYAIIDACLLIALLAIYTKNIQKNKTNPSLHQDPSLDLETAKRVQEALLSITPPQSEKIEIAKRCIPASTLGGDFYTFVNKAAEPISQQSNQKGIIQLLDKPEKLLGITIGDVAGHGVSSALVMALTSGILNRIGFNNRSPSVILQRANTDIQKFISHSNISHVTAFYSIINLDNLTLKYSSAGHPPGILIRKDLSYKLLATDGVFLGMFPNEQYHENSVQLITGDRLILFTDGIIETMNSKKETFGIDRLIETSIDNSNLNAKTFTDLVFNTIDSFREGVKQRDDQTIVVMDIK